MLYSAVQYNHMPTSYGSRPNPSTYARMCSNIVLIETSLVHYKTHTNYNFCIVHNPHSYVLTDIIHTSTYIYSTVQVLYCTVDWKVDSILYTLSIRTFYWFCISTRTFDYVAAGRR